jgi:hypothetical protein
MILSRNVAMRGRRRGCLHRKEGDQDNAAYWFSRAGKPVWKEPLDSEWVSIVMELLG